MEIFWGLLNARENRNDTHVNIIQGYILSTKSWLGTCIWGPDHSSDGSYCEHPACLLTVVYEKNELLEERSNKFYSSYTYSSPDGCLLLSNFCGWPSAVSSGVFFIFLISHEYQGTLSDHVNTEHPSIAKANGSDGGKYWSSLFKIMLQLDCCADVCLIIMI